tara:strand:+ start:546 stop:800 length:255 start_codon:yes stop_codon:yes gene_type:complete
MGYNIMKIMKDPITGKNMNVLLTDGLSQIWTIKKLSEVNRIVKMMEENSDSGHQYEVRGEPCQTSKLLKVTDIVGETPKTKKNK